MRPMATIQMVLPIGQRILHTVSLADDARDDCVMQLIMEQVWFGSVLG